MILRAVLFGLVLLAVLLLQAVIAPVGAVAGVTPDLIVLAVLVLGVAEGPGTGMRFGFAAGLAVDLLGTGEGVLGVTALVLLLAGYAAGLTRPYITASLLVGQVVVAGVGSAAVIVVRTVLAALLGIDVGDAWGVVVEILVVGAYAGVLAPPFALALARLGRLVPDEGAQT